MSKTTDECKVCELKVGLENPGVRLKGEYTEVETLKINYIKGAEATNADVASVALVDSVAKYGILGPLMIARLPGGKLYLMGGYKRLDAAAKLRMVHVPAVVMDVEDENGALELFRELHATRKMTANWSEGKFMAGIQKKNMPEFLL